MNKIDTSLQKLQDLAVEMHYTKNFTAILDLLQKVLDCQDAIDTRINDLQSNIEDIRERMITK